ncbi:MAG: flagellar hook-associated protein FlgK [Desulfovibrionales bacterium]|nr:flagellar hook-associated protein FlgK [Desulfovibrionales bacterium]
MPGVTSLLDIGKKSLFASQAAIEVVGNNISNANTEGYSRQAVVLEDGLYINYSPGQLGTGVNATQVIRHFDEFVEKQYNAKLSEQERWSTLYSNLNGLEKIFNEANSGGLNAVLSQFWASWQDLSADPENSGIRNALLGHAFNLQNAVQAAEEDLQALQTSADDAISQEVDTINAILANIASINTQITVSEETGRNNANGLRDERAALVRQLSEKMDITYIDNGLGNVTVLTKAGQTLVDGARFFRLAFEGPQTIADLASPSAFDGTVGFSGESSTGYTVKIVDAGAVGTATYRVSNDGGKTWLTDGNGVSIFTTSESGLRLPDGRGVLTFDAGSGNPLAAGDTFHVLTQKTLFWYETATSKVNITPQVLPNGGDNERRLTGGSLAGYFQFRDASAGGYIEMLDAFSSSLAWEVNRIHSQGAGTDRFAEVVGTYGVSDAASGLGTAEAGLVFRDRLTNGNVMVYVYDQTTGVLKNSQPLFSGVNFDPQAHSLEDVVAAFSSIEGIEASILGGRLHLAAEDGSRFAFGSDSSGLMAALGINTFFDGSDARTLTLNATVANNPSFINAGHVNGAGEMNRGDNTTASAIASLQRADVRIGTSSGGITSQTLGEYYSAFVALIGSDTANAKFRHEFNAALAADLKAQQEAVSGVNLDEEMTNLIKFQHAYTAAAKLVTTAESMLEVLLGLKS